MKSPVIILHGDDEKIIFQVKSSKGDENYMVAWDFDNGWLCTCQGCLQGRHLCRHILLCEEYMKKMNMALLDDPSVYGGLVDG